MGDAPESVCQQPPGSARQRSREGASEQADVAGRFDVLLEISRSLAGKLDLPVVLSAAMNSVCRLLDTEGASILLIDPETRHMRFFAAAGPDSEAVRRIRVPPGAGICGYVARTGEPLIVVDARSDPRVYHPVDDTTGLITRSLLCVPVRSSERLWGVLELFNKRADGGFSADDQRIAEVVASQTALALENAHLHERVVQEERLAAIGQTVSGLAHCIKNILNGIRSGSAVIDRALTSRDLPHVADGWRTVRNNNDALSTLVLDMLALARSSKLHPFPTDVNDLARQVAELMTARAGERHISVSFTPAAGLSEVWLDPTRFYRCLLNLVTNAVEACAEGGAVRICVFRSGGRDRFTVSVTDDGEGISQDDRGKLFKEFFTTKGSRGTGLGLPVTRKLMDEMDGTIKFHSTAGKGTRFVLALPIRRPPGEQQEAST